MKKIDKLKNSSANRIAKKSANLSSNLPSLVLREQNAATLSTQLHYAERQLFVPDWISKRDTRTSLPPPLYLSLSFSFSFYLYLSVFLFFSAPL